MNKSEPKLFSKTLHNTNPMNTIEIKQNIQIPVYFKHCDAATDDITIAHLYLSCKYHSIEHSSPMCLTYYKNLIILDPLFLQQFTIKDAMPVSFRSALFTYYI